MYVNKEDIIRDLERYQKNMQVRYEESGAVNQYDIGIQEGFDRCIDAIKKINDNSLFNKIKAAVCGDNESSEGQKK